MFQLTYCAIDRLSSIRLWRSKERKVHSAGDRSTIDSIDHDVRCLLPLNHGTGAADGEGGHFGKDSTAGDYVRPPECAGFEQPSLGADRVTSEERRLEVVPSSGRESSTIARQKGGPLPRLVLRTGLKNLNDRPGLFADEEDGEEE